MECPWDEAWDDVACIFICWLANTPNILQYLIIWNFKSFLSQEAAGVLNQREVKIQSQREATAILTQMSERQIRIGFHYTVPEGFSHLP